MSNNRMNELMERVENAYNKSMPKDPKGRYELDRERGRATLELSFAISQSVLGKLLDPQGTKGDTKEYFIDKDTESIKTDNNGCRDNIRRMINDLAHEHNRILYGEELQNQYGTKGVLIDSNNNVVVDSYVNQESTTKRVDGVDNNTYSDGMELVSVANKVLTEEIFKQLERDGVVDLDKSYKYEKLARRVYIGYTDIEPKTEIVEKSPFAIAVSAVRYSIKNNASLKIETTPYCYLSEMVEIEGETETVYKRLPKNLTYTLLGEDKLGLPSVGDYAQTLLEAIDNANLTPQQARVLSYKYDGIGITTIADKMDISKQAVSKHIKNIGNKLGGKEFYKNIEERDREREESEKNFIEAVRAHREFIAAERDRESATKSIQERRENEREESKQRTISLCSIKAKSEREYSEKMRFMNERIEREKRRYEGVTYVTSRPNAIDYFYVSAKNCTRLIDLANNDTYINGFAPCPITMMENYADNFRREYWKIRQGELKRAIAILERKERVKRETEKFDSVMARLEKNRQETTKGETVKSTKTKEEIMGEQKKHSERMNTIRMDALRRENERERARKEKCAERERRTRERTRERREREAETRLMKELGLA